MNNISIPGTFSRRAIASLGPLVFAVLVSLHYARGQSASLVWADEFNGTAIDRSVWSFGIGLTNDNIQYYTDRSENAQAAGGELQIIARKESYNGFNYTSALLQTKNAVAFRHGRVEARIKVPGGAGFVPAFWMMPADDMYGWWPNSGEIDIMEHPTTQPDKIYGTAHARAYNSYTGTAPKSATLQVPDAETAFHVYAIEWSGEQIDFYVDQTKYFTVTNDHAGPQTWPFDQPFYIILNLAVGGGWVGTPPSTVTFPVAMEVDYVRVYQLLGDVRISGKDVVAPAATNTRYSVPSLMGAAYRWSVPPGASIVGGQGTHEVAVNWGNSSGNIGVTIVAANDSTSAVYPVVVSNNLLYNSGFEKGAKYWNGIVSYPLQGSFDLDSSALTPGSHWVKATVSTIGANPWDVQMTQPGFTLEGGKQYEGRFRAKADISGRSVNASVIDARTFSPYSSKTLVLSDVWKEYSFRFTATQNAIGSFNIDLGLQTGTYYLDDISLIDVALLSGVDAGTHDTPETAGLEQNWPNPFNPSTEIAYTVDSKAVHGSEFMVHGTEVKLVVYDLLGREVAVLVNEKQAPGRYTVRFDGSRLASGVYLYRLQAGNYVETRRMVLLR